MHAPLYLRQPRSKLYIGLLDHPVRTLRYLYSWSGLYGAGFTVGIVGALAGLAQMIIVRPPPLLLANSGAYDT